MRVWRWCMREIPFFTKRIRSIPAANFRPPSGLEVTGTGLKCAAYSVWAWPPRRCGGCDGHRRLLGDDSVAARHVAWATALAGGIGLLYTSPPYFRRVDATASRTSCAP